MPVRKCKTCGHAYFMHEHAEWNGKGPCSNMIRDENGNKLHRCDCTEYVHDPASGPF